MTDRAGRSEEGLRPVALPRRRLWMHLGVSLFVCLFVIAAGGSNTGSVAAFEVTAIVAIVYWLVFAVLQVIWWRKGYQRFWRPTYFWAGTGLLVLGFLGLPLLLLIVPSIRRWLFRKLRPYDPPTSGAHLPVTASTTTASATEQVPYERPRPFPPPTTTPERPEGG